MTVTIAGLTSGDGELLLSLHERAEKGTLDSELAVVLSDRDAPALEAADETGVEARRIERDGEKHEHEERIAEKIRNVDADLVALDGYMPILSDGFVDEFRHRIVSSHPSLLPAFNTTDPWQAALDAGVEVTGATVQFVAEEIGGGPS